MILASALLALAGQPAAAPARPAFRMELTDVNVAAQGGNDLLLENAINRVLFEDLPVQAALRRAGLERGCLLLHGARRRTVEAHRAEFRRHLVTAVRALVPAERLATSTNMIVGGLAGYRTRVTDEVQRTAEPLYARAASQALTGAATALATAPAVAPAQSAGRFSDWRLETPLSRQIACNLIVSSQGPTPAQFASMKSAFDGFYRRTNH